MLAIIISRPALRVVVSRVFVLFIFLSAGLLFPRVADAETFDALSLDGWDGVSAGLPNADERTPCTVGAPGKKKEALTYETEETYPAGRYELKLRVQPSHPTGLAAWKGSLSVKVNGKEIKDFSGFRFKQTHVTETRTVRFTHPRSGRIKISLEAKVPRKAFEKWRVRNVLEGGDNVTPNEGGNLLSEDKEKDVDGLDLSVSFKANPEEAFYYLLKSAQLRCITETAVVQNTRCDKILYKPGETLEGRTEITPFQTNVKGELRIFLEHKLNQRQLIQKQTVSVEDGKTETLRFQLELPDASLGHAVVARFIPDSGEAGTEDSAYFNIARNFYRVAIFGEAGGAATTLEPRDELKEVIEKNRRNYQNSIEFFAWAEEDMVEMSPESDYWFSGQTTYHVSKQGLKTFIQEAHKRGISCVTYGKFVMSGYLGWETAYTYPNDHKNQFYFQIGMWNGCNVVTLDRYKYKEFNTYMSAPSIEGRIFKNTAWQDFMPINPDPTPRMTRIAAEEMKRSVAMFDWDAVRWDGHPRVGGQRGGRKTKKYSYESARRNQLLVRYFKDIVNKKYPEFQHGYNYLHVQDDPYYEWAIEDFELDELCEGGGLLMNESIRNSAGKELEWVARNLQVEGDLARERGGYLLGISTDGAGGDDCLAEAALYFSAGCRPMGGVAKNHPWNRRFNRYATRFSNFVFNENMRRLEKPEKVLEPTGEVGLWWRPFVYETPHEKGKAHLVVNLLNIPKKKRLESTREKKRDNMRFFKEANKPFHFTCNLPENYTLEKAHFIDPWTLNVTSKQCSNNQIEVPSVAFWKVLVLELDVDTPRMTMAKQYGPPRTTTKQRKGVDPDTRKPLTPLSLEQTPQEVHQDWQSRFGGWGNEHFKESADVKQLSMEERNEALRERQLAKKVYMNTYVEGGKIPADNEMKDDPPEFENLAPAATSGFEILYARGPMDYNHRTYEALGRLNTVRVTEATLKGGRGSYKLRNNPDPRGFSDYNVLIYNNIPHCAIGVKQSYALVDYVRNGGGVLFTGGEYAFGKGLYDYTVLDRTLLPVDCIENVDTRYTRNPLPLEQGEDFDKLGVSPDFSSQPAVWGWNEVALKPSEKIRVFLRCGNRPILVGWELGKGRVACLLAMHKGRDTEEKTAYFNWKDWPQVFAGVLRWLRADTETLSSDGPVLSKAEKEQLVKDLQGESLENLLDEGQDQETAFALDQDSQESSQEKVHQLSDSELKSRREKLGRLLQAPPTKDVSQIFTEQLNSVGNFPLNLTFRLVDAIREKPYAELSKKALGCINAGHIRVRGVGCQLLAVADSKRFGKEIRSGPEKLESNPKRRKRYLAIAIPLYSESDLLKHAEKRIAKWNKLERETQKRWTGGDGFSLRRPPMPCLAEDPALERFAWLAYASQWRPEKHARQLAHEWARLGQYQDYCNRHILYLFNRYEQSNKANQLAQKTRFVRTLFQRQESLGRERLREVFSQAPAEVTKGLASVRFRRSALNAVKFLGQRNLKKHPDLREILQKADQEPLKSYVHSVYSQ